MNITEERMNELVAIIGDLPINRWHVRVSEKKMTWFEWAHLCRLNYTPKATATQAPLLPARAPHWNEDAFVREMEG